jgi:Fe2+ or Zn2+ uptake regulation protein
MKRRHTKQRQAILDVLRRSRSHPTADMVYEEVKKLIPALSKGTVYRNLKVLLEEGEISELALSGTMSRYEGNGKDHYHFICERCGKIIDLEEPIDRDLDRHLEEKTGL